MKICSTCKTEKSFDDFYKYKKTKDGYYNVCKKCKAKYDKKYCSSEKRTEKLSKQQKTYNIDDVKICSKCKIEKSLGEFCKHKKSKDGHYNICKECKTIQDKEYRNKNKKKIAKQKKEYSSRKEIKEAKTIYDKQWSKNNPDKILKNKLSDWQRNPTKNKARRLVNRAIKAGVLTKQSCEVCRSLIVEAHHENYDKPLEVRWLCKDHHLEAHGGQWNKLLFKEEVALKQKMKEIK